MTALYHYKAFLLLSYCHQYRAVSLFDPCFQYYITDITVFSTLQFYSLLGCQRWYSISPRLLFALHFGYIRGARFSLHYPQYIQKLVFLFFYFFLSFNLHSDPYQTLSTLYPCPRLSFFMFVPFEHRADSIFYSAIKRHANILICINQSRHLSNNHQRYSLSASLME